MYYVHISMLLTTSTILHPLIVDKRKISTLDFLDIEGH